MRMRVLYLGTNRNYPNPNFQLFPMLWKCCANTFFYGPGYTDPSILKNGVTAYLRRIGMVDCVVIDASIVFWNEETGERPFKGVDNHFDYSEVKKSFSDMLEFYLSIDTIKVLYTNFDYYYLSTKEAELLRSADPLLITRDLAFWRKKADIENLNQEYFSGSVNDNWFEYIVERPDRIISFPGVIGEHEFCYTPMNRRKYDVTIPGAKYYHRRMAREGLVGSKLSVDVSLFNWKQKIISKLLLKTSSRYISNLIGSRFTRSLQNSKTAFTCGSALGFPIRKFIEIPANGALLLCQPFFGFEEFGFQDGVNVSICKPEELEDMVHYYLDNTDDAISISKAGQEMVLRNHSFSSRCRQLLQVIAAITQGKFNGTCWKNGNFKLLD